MGLVWFSLGVIVGVACVCSVMFARELRDYNECNEFTSKGNGDDNGWTQKKAEYMIDGREMTPQEIADFDKSFKRFDDSMAEMSDHLTNIFKDRQ